MRLLSASLLAAVVMLSSFPVTVSGHAPESATATGPIFGFRDAAAENATEVRFLAVPDPKLAEEHLRVLTQAPHMAGTPEDKATADYVAQKFRDAGLETEIVEYKVWMNYPRKSAWTSPRLPGLKCTGLRASTWRAIHTTMIRGW